MTKPERQIKRKKKGPVVEVNYQKLVPELLPHMTEVMKKTLPNKEQYDAAIEALNVGNQRLKELNNGLVGEFSTSLQEVEKRLDAIEEKLGIKKSDEVKELEALAADIPPVLPPETL